MRFYWSAIGFVLNLAQLAYDQIMTNIVAQSNTHTVSRYDTVVTDNIAHGLQMLS